MEGEEWVIDTSVLVKAYNPSTESDLDAQAFIQTVRLSHHIAIDFQAHIVSEYRRNVMKYTPFRLWWEAMWRLGRIVQRDGLLNSRQCQYLINSLHFDGDDLPFVAVASKGTSKYLVAIESDYTQEVQDYLRSQVGVTTFNTSAALKKASA